MSMKKLLGAGLMAGAMLMTAPATGFAQARPVSGGDDSTVLFGAGITFMNVAEQTGIGVAANGLFNTLKTTGNGRIGIVGDFGLNDFDGGTVVTVMGGARYTFTTQGKVAPYGQLLVGLVHCCGDTDFDPSLGFGIDVAWKPNLNFRGELSFIFEEEDAARFFFGVSMPLSKKR